MTAEGSVIPSPKRSFTPDVWQSDYQVPYTNRIMTPLKSRKLHQCIGPVFPNHCINLTDRKSIPHNSIIPLSCLTERIYEQLMNQVLNERVWHYMTKCIIDNYWLPYENIKVHSILWREYLKRWHTAQVKEKGRLCILLESCILKKFSISPLIVSFGCLCITLAYFCVISRNRKKHQNQK